MKKLVQLPNGRMIEIDTMTNDEKANSILLTSILMFASIAVFYLVAVVGAALFYGGR